MKKRVICWCLAAILAFGSLAGCGETGTAIDSTHRDAEITEISENNEETRIFKDSAGRDVEVAADITRIIPSGPLSQMMLFALAPDKLVGLSNGWSEDAKQYIDSKYYDLPVVGQLYGGKSDLNPEQLASANPQVVIDIGEEKSTITEDMDTITQQTGIPSVHISCSLSNAGEAFRMLGDLLGMNDEAERIAAYCDDTYSMAAATMEAIGEDNKKKVVYCVGENGLYIIPNGSYHSEVIDLIANNIAIVDNPSSKGTGNEIDMEQMYIWDPDVIIFQQGSIYDSVANDKSWKELTAIKNGTYYEVPYGIYNWMGSPPSVNRLLGMQWLIKLLYPEKADYDMYTVAKGYYEMFCHCTLSQEQYQTLVSNSLEK